MPKKTFVKNVYQFLLKNMGKLLGKFLPNKDLKISVIRNMFAIVADIFGLTIAAWEFSLYK